MSVFITESNHKSRQSRKVLLWYDAWRVLFIGNQLVKICLVCPKYAIYQSKNEENSTKEYTKGKEATPLEVRLCVRWKCFHGTIAVVEAKAGTTAATSMLFVRYKREFSVVVVNHSSFKTEYQRHKERERVESEWVRKSEKKVAYWKVSPKMHLFWIQSTTHIHILMPHTQWDHCMYWTVTYSRTMQ